MTCYLQSVKEKKLFKVFFFYPARKIIVNCSWPFYNINIKDHSKHFKTKIVLKPTIPSLGHSMNYLLLSNQSTGFGSASKTTLETIPLFLPIKIKKVK